MRVLTWISAFLRWLEELAAHVSGPALTIGLGIALVDLLTDGKLLATVPALLFGWAIAQAIGVDGQLVGASAKAGRAWRAGRYWVVAGYLLLVLALGYVAMIASLVFASQQAYGISTSAALSRLGMDATAWLWQRCALAVFLVILSGFLRFEEHAVAATESDADREQRMRRERDDLAHKNAMRALRFAGLGAAARATVDGIKATATADDEPATILTEVSDEPADDETQEPRTMTPRRAVRAAAPAGMMSAPEFQRYLADNGVTISEEEARKTVRNAAGFRKVGTTYYADRRALNAVAKRRINEAHPTIQLVG